MIAPIGAGQPGGWMWVASGFPSLCMGWAAWRRCCSPPVTMRTTSNASNPWGNSIDDGWKDLVVSSAPPPPPTPRDARESSPKNRPLPADITTWQEHGAARGAEAAVVDEPGFSAGDRRLWVIAGTLMGLAALVLGLLGVLTFGNLSSGDAAAEAAHPVAVAPVPTAPTPSHVADPARVASAAAVAKPTANSPRALKRTKHARHHKRMASR